ncbi:type II toxin-antitoxin system VapC family toxin [Actinomycetospora atypica]|uniref:Type II toxin-antitoxin system VapC family toxin n=1 Tax=Actinomycetospora atypica TaxID=1290095 RepID=A0ABV9YMF3_9PSEU
MRLLADTQVVIWAATGSPRLSVAARSALESESNDLVCSVISLWEVAIKEAVGKLELDVDLRTWLAEVGIRELPVTGEHAQEFAGLPVHHRDPFDRMLVAQARHEGLTLVTADRRLEAYSVAVLRADG